jgi:hypothetical protein
MRNYLASRIQANEFRQMVRVTRCERSIGEVFLRDIESRSVLLLLYWLGGRYPNGTSHEHGHCFGRCRQVAEPCF